MPSIVQINKLTGSTFTVPSGSVLKSGVISWDGTDGAEGQKAYVQFRYGGVTVLNAAIDFKDGKHLEIEGIEAFNQEISISCDKGGCTIVFFEHNLGVTT